MSYRHVALTGLFLLSAIGVSWAQGSIQWRVDMQEAAARAQRSLRPLLVYVPGSRDSDESDLEDAQDAAFRNVTVRGLVQERYVPVRLRRTNTTDELLRRLGTPRAYGMYLLVLTPEGELVGRLEPNDTANARLLVRKLVQNFRTYRQKLFGDRLEDQLTGKQLNERAARSALQTIRGFLIAQADQAVVQLLKRDDIDDNLKQAAWRTLATLSTKTSIEALLKAAAAERDARNILDRCTPAGAEYMLPALVGEDGTVRHYVYEAVTAICNIRNARPRTYWENAERKRVEAELERVRQRVREVAEKWREQYEPLR